MIAERLGAAPRGQDKRGSHQDLDVAAHDDEHGDRIEERKADQPPAAHDVPEGEEVEHHDQHLQHRSRHCSEDSERHGPRRSVGEDPQLADVTHVHGGT